MPPFITGEKRTRHLRSHSSSSRRRESAARQTPLGEQSRTTNTRNPSRTCSSSLVVRHIVHNVRSGAWGSHAQGPEHDVRGTPPSSQGRDRFHDELPLPQRSCAELQMLHGGKKKKEGQRHAQTKRTKGGQAGTREKFHFTREKPHQARHIG